MGASTVFYCTLGVQSLWHACHHLATVLSRSSSSIEALSPASRHLRHELKRQSFELQIQELTKGGRKKISQLPKVQQRGSLVWYSRQFARERGYGFCFALRMS